MGGGIVQKTYSRQHKCMRLIEHGLYYVCCTVAGLTMKSSQYLNYTNINMGRELLPCCAYDIMHVQHTNFEGEGRQS